MPVPDDISDDAAACLAVNPVTTIGLLKVLGAVPHDEYVVITAAGSAVGKQLLALCKVRRTCVCVCVCVCAYGSMAFPSWQRSCVCSVVCSACTGMCRRTNGAKPE